MASETMTACYVKVEMGFVVQGSDGAQLVKTHTYQRTFSDGSGAEQAQTVWNDDARPLNATSETLDLDGLVDFKGATMSDNTGVRVLLVENLSTADRLTVGGGDWSGTAQMLTGSTDKINIGAGGLLLWVKPGTSGDTSKGTITATSADGLTFNSGSDATGNYKIALVLTNT